MNIAARIMWYSKARPRPDHLVESLQTFDAQAVEDSIGQGCWNTSRRCWLSGIESGADYVMVLADDALLCKDFRVVVTRAITSRPNHIIGLFALNELVERLAIRAFDTSKRWVDTNLWCNGVGLLMISSIAREFIAWSDEHLSDDITDDETRVILFCIATHRLIAMCNPSIIEHNPAMVTTHASHISNENVRAWRFAGDGASNLDWPSEGIICIGDDRVVVHQNKRYFKYTSHLRNFYGID